MRRALVLTDESKRHPYRASLPPHVVLEVSPLHRLGLTRRDWRDVLATYAAGFAAVITFIS